MVGDCETVADVQAVNAAGVGDDGDDSAVVQNVGGFGGGVSAVAAVEDVDSDVPSGCDVSGDCCAASCFHNHSMSDQT